MSLIIHYTKGGTFTGIYALTEDGELLSINLNGYDSNTSKYTYALGLSYEDNTTKGFVYGCMDDFLQVTKDDYLRDSSDIQANYIVDSNNNKITVKYLFSSPDNKVYIVTLDDKLYSLTIDTSGKYFKYNPAELLNNKTVNDINYDNNNKVFTVTYTDNTTDKFNVGQYFDASKTKYGF